MVQQCWVGRGSRRWTWVSMLEGLQDGSIETGVLGQDIMQDPLRRCLLLGRLRFLFFSCTKIAAPIVGNSRGLTPSIDGRSSLVFNMTNDSIEELFQRPDPRVSHRVNFVHHKLCRASKAGSILEDLESVSVDDSLSPLSLLELRVLLARWDCGSGQTRHWSWYRRSRVSITRNFWIASGGRVHREVRVVSRSHAKIAWGGQIGSEWVTLGHVEI